MSYYCVYIIYNKCFRHFYEENSKNYNVQPEDILPGLIYVSMYSTFLSDQQWRRVRVLKEVNSTTVEVRVEKPN